jgi:hypothetical protein
MAKKLKFDTKVFTKFALDKGERVGLGLAAAVMVLFVGYGVWIGLGAKSPHDTIKKEIERVDNMIQTANPSDEDRKKFDELAKKPPGDWYPLSSLEQFASAGSWFDPGAAGTSKRVNPSVLPVGEAVAAKVKTLQIDPLKGGVVRFDYSQKRETLGTLKPGTGGGPSGFPGGGPAPVPSPLSGGDDNFTRLIQPTRMVVVSATFPYRDQLEVTRKALRMSSVKELQDAQLMPTFLGLNVYRVELLPGGKTSEPKALYEYDPAKDRTVVGLPRTELLLTTAEYDQDNVSLLTEYIVPGLVTPLPKLVNASYPKLDLAGIDLKGADGDGGEKPEPVPGPPGKIRPPNVPAFPGANPSFPGAKSAPGAERPAEAGGPKMEKGTPVAISKLTDKNLQDRLKGNINFFDPNGASLDEGNDDDKAPAPVKPPMFNKGRLRGPAAVVPPKSPAPMGDKSAGEPEKLLVRFFDADVEPGKTYQYSIQVRMANPNFGKKAEVAYAGLAEAKELPSPFTITPAITIGQEFVVYAAEVNPKQLVSKIIGPTGAEKDPVSSERVALQIHRWVDEERDGPTSNLVADWAIAERLLIHRGEALGRARVEVELPVWDAFIPPHGQFTLAVTGGNSKGKLGRGLKQAAPVDFLPRDRPPGILVDFEGGKRAYATGTGNVYDDGATELLVLDPDGKLVVRTSRDDADPDSEAGAERIRRYEAWRTRISDLRQTNNPMMPVMPNPR